MAYIAQIDYVTVDCPRHGCGVIFAIPNELDQRLRQSCNSFYCPHGHTMSYSKGDTDLAKRDAAEARARHLEDQLHAAQQEAETTRQNLLRDRSRFANGVCPCCNRTFQNVMRHMQSQHPGYDPAVVKPPRYRCSCGSDFESYHGLRIHQGRMGQDLTAAYRWRQHATVVELANA